MLTTFLLSIAAPALAAPCCSGGASQDSILIGDERARVTLSGSQVVDSTASRTTRLSAGVVTLLSDRWQASVTVPYVFQLYAWDPNLASGLGDVSLGVNWEALPEFSYSAWRPKGFLFGGVKVPVGYYDPSGHRLGLGVPAVSVGALLFKAWGPWDMTLAADIEWQSGPLKASSTISGGLSVLSRFRVGPFVRRALFWELGAAVSAMFGDWTFTVSAKEALGIERVLALAVSRAWGR